MDTAQPSMIAPTFSPHFSFFSYHFPPLLPRSQPQRERQPLGQFHEPDGRALLAEFFSPEPVATATKHTKRVLQATVDPVSPLVCAVAFCSCVLSISTRMMAKTKRR